MGEIAEVYIKTKRAARKNHICYECEGIIPNKEEYFYHHGVFDKVGFGEKVCSDCNNLINEQNDMLDFDDCVGLGELCEFIFNGNEVSDIKRFIDIKLKRRAKVEEWMFSRIK